MGFWHGTIFYEQNRVRDEMLGFFLTWPQGKHYIRRILALIDEFRFMIVLKLEGIERTTLLGEGRVEKG